MIRSPGRFQEKSSTESNWMFRSRSRLCTNCIQFCDQRGKTVFGCGSLQQSATPELP